jgi:Fe-S-cluster containining protein
MGKSKLRARDEREFVIPYARGKLSTRLGEYEFYYPKGVRWGCKKCGSCCRDASHRPRNVLLLPADVKKLEEAGEREFMFEVKGKEPFVAEMRKVGGSCIYLIREGCRVYQARALLCRMYPFWVEREGRSLEVRVDTRCSGFGHGGELKEEFYHDLLINALEQRGED